jgi:hypothetical protein
VLIRSHDDRTRKLESKFGRLELQVVELALAKDRDRERAAETVVSVKEEEKYQQLHQQMAQLSERLSAREMKTIKALEKDPESAAALRLQLHKLHEEVKGQLTLIREDLHEVAARSIENTLNNRKDCTQELTRLSNILYLAGRDSEDLRKLMNTRLAEMVTCKQMQDMNNSIHLKLERLAALVN